jgi:FtsZ-interacting cell division protein YlmF
MSRLCVCAQNLQKVTNVVFLCTPSVFLVYACDAVLRQEHMNLHA